MSLDVSVHHIALDTATGQETKTGIPAPKGLIGFLVGDTAAGWVDQNPIYMNMGMASSPTARGAHTAGLIDGAADTGNFRRGHQVDRWMTAVKQNTNTENAGVDLVSLNADGYTYDIVTAPSGALLALVAGIGGDAVEELEVVTFEAPTDATGDHDFTVLSFEPDLVILQANGRIATGFGGGGAFAIGAFNNAGEQFAAFGHVMTGGPGGDCSRGLRGDRCYFVQTPGGGQSVGFTWTAMLPDGFRLNATEIADGQEITAFCIKGAFRHKILAFNKTTSAAPVDQDIEVGIPPKLALYVSAMKTTGTSQTDHNRLCIGLTDGANHRCYAWGEEDLASPTNVQAYISLDKGGVKANNTSQTIDASFAPSFVDEKVRLGWDVNDGVADEGVLLVLADPEEAPEQTVGRAHAAASGGA